MAEHDRSGTTNEVTEDPLGAFGEILAGMADSILSALDDEGVDLGALGEPEPPITDEWEFVLTFDEAAAIARSVIQGDETAVRAKAKLNRLVIDCLTEAVVELEDAA